MRTTIDLSEAILRKAKKLAQEKQTSVKSLIEEGLRLVFERNKTKTKYRLEDHSYGKGGLIEGLSEHDFEEIRHRAYEGRGS